MTEPPPGAVCIFPGCSAPATDESLVGMSEGAPDCDGMPDPDGVTLHVEWVCKEHK